MRHYREPTDLLPFEELSEGEVHQRRVFGVRSDRVRSRLSGRELTVDRLITPDWVNVVALADDDELGQVLLCVRQYRFGTREMSLEVPAGLVDPGEDARTAALRELREETGYAPVDDDEVVALGAVRPNAAFMQNRMSTFFVPRAHRVAELDLDEHEEIEVVKMPAAEVEGAVKAGLFENAMVLVALYKWRLHAGAGPGGGGAP